MGAPTPLVGLPVPFGFDGNNMPVDVLAFAQRLDDIFNPHTYDEISALGGADLWDGRIMYQSDSGALRLFAGLYAYKSSTATWQTLVPRLSTPWTPTLKFSGAAPSFGTGVEQTGRYSRFGTLIIGQFVIFTGSSGFVSVPLGQIQIDLPVPFTSALTPTPIGVLSHLDQTGLWARARLVAGDTLSWAPTTTQVVAYKGGGGTTNAPPATVMASAWANNQTLWGTIIYDTPEA